jgi:hypothetical protein
LARTKTLFAPRHGLLIRSALSGVIKIIPDGGTGLGPVVSGVAPETSCDQTRLTNSGDRDLSLRLKSGATPVPPF